ncbi:MAG: BamA/TamA family outer membrane protein [Gemmatimonadota bacterium]|nr:BamA/TamA family outer membrane protein [Gemmatimonadota bacterium]MDH5758490.1 BamA/TamA family outer membrane protein [Gemmatimonadota bacterium]
MGFADFLRVVPLLCVLALAPTAVLAQSNENGARGSGALSTGLEVGALPALNYDADEGFGYGALAELYQYGDGARGPYLWTLQPTVFLTTGGRRDFTLFFDTPHLLPGGWRMDVFLGSEEQLATPYYGMGNDTPYEAALETDADPYYYRMGRTRRGMVVNLQRPLGGLPIRGLLGAGVVHIELDPVPDDQGTTLLAVERAAGAVPDLGGWHNYLRAGLVWDSRDRETGPGSGVWTEILVQRVDGALGGDYDYTRWTVADRRYFSLGPRLVYANRLLLQGVGAGAPLHDLNRLQTSFKQQEGLGGGKSVRGIPKNRFVGRGMFLWNAELRWRAADFDLVGRSFHVVLSAFLDQGRTWADAVDAGEILSDLHRGYGGGVRVGMGENFTVAVDAGTSADGGTPLYIGLGYLY